VTALGTLAQIAERTGGRVIGDPNVAIDRLVAVDDADAVSLTFATDERYLRSALASRAGAVLTDAALVDAATTYAKPIVAVPSTRVALAALLAALEPVRPHGAFVHPSAAVDATARVGSAVYIDAQVAVGAGAAIGSGTYVGAGVVIGPGARIGTNCVLHPRAYVANDCILGDRVVLQAGAVIGSDGFGYAVVDGEFKKIPQIGIVELGDDVEIGANTCIDRAQTGVTAVGRGSKIDNLCQIAHNCRIGEHSAIAALCGLSGSTIVGDHTQIAGQSGTRGHLTIGSRVTLGGRSGVWADVPDGAFWTGNPARPHREYLRGEALVARLPQLYDRVKALEKRAPAEANET
jgi:UDP-3-O-[3-hydroxymyristoyl] glucosamine N-acyltransferase